jgi:hypothetical protein
MRHDGPITVATSHSLFDRYAESVPGPDAIETLIDLGPLVEA